MTDTAETPERLPIGRGSSSISETLRARVISGTYLKGHFLPPVRDLSREFGVSSGTICRALKPLEAEGLVAAKPRHGYQVLYESSAPILGAPIGFILRKNGADVDPGSLAQLFMTYAQQAAAQKGWSLLGVDREKAREEKITEQLKQAKVWGALVDTHGPEFIHWARAAGISVVMVDAWHEDLSVDAVVQDGFRGGVLAAQYLVDRGHERIAWAGRTTRTVAHSMARFGGAVTALRRRGLSLPASRIIDGELPDVNARVRKLLARSDRPTGILALWRDQALGVARAAKELGLKLGKDLDLVGWCAEEQYDRDYAAHLPDIEGPPAIVWSLATLFRIATARLAERHANPDLPPVRISVETRLKVGK